MRYLEVKFLGKIDKNFDNIFKLNNIDIAIINSNNEFSINIQNTCNTDEDILNIFYRMYEILYFLCGKFLKIKSIRFIDCNEGVLKPYPVKIHRIYRLQKSKDFIIKVNLEKIIEQLDFKDTLIKWIEYRNKLNAQINSYLLVTTKNIYKIGYNEIGISILLQSMEGFVTGCLKDKLLYQDKKITIKKNDEYREAYCKELKYCDIRNIQYADKLKLMLEQCRNSILKEECQKKRCSIFNSYEDVVNKCNNTRNYIAHMDYDSKRNIFKSEEMKYYLEKLILIYRMNILSLLDIDSEDIKESINYQVEMINECFFKSNYYNNRKKCEKCRNKSKCKYEDIKLISFDEVIGDIYGRKVYKKRN